ncbi:hypothetical protein M406DRAFT_250576, partial [Cryphonectria parasitica EP155]
RLQLSLTINFQDFEVMPYSFCISKGLECKMIEGIKRCSCCVRWGRSCDGSSVPVNALSRIITELGCLDRKELDAEKVLLELQSKLGEATARLVRLRKQKRSLHDRGAKMVSQSLRSLDELEEEERWKEDARRAAESEAVVEAQSWGALDVVDWDNVLGGVAASDFCPEASGSRFGAERSS